MNGPVFVPNNPSGKLTGTFKPPKPLVSNPDTSIIIPDHKGASMFKKPGTEITPTQKRGTFLSYIERANIRPSGAASISSAPKEKSLTPGDKEIFIRPLSTPSPKRELSREAKNFLEADSAAFVSLAQKKEALEDKKNMMDPWDEAILHGTYPGGRTPIKIDSSSAIPAAVNPSVGTGTAENLLQSHIPAKPKEQPSAPILSNRVFEPKTELRHFNIKKNEEPKPISVVAPIISDTPTKKETATPFISGIPKKPEKQEELSAPIRYEGLIPKNIIPRKPLKAQIFL